MCIRDSLWSVHGMATYMKRSHSEFISDSAISCYHDGWGQSELVRMEEISVNNGENIQWHKF